MHNPTPVLENDTHKLLWDSDIHADHLISARWSDLIIINKKKREFAKLSTLLSRLTTEWNWRNVKRRKSTLILVENWRKLWIMRVTIVPVVIDAFDTVTKGLLKGLVDLEVGRRVKTIQTTALLKTARILRRVLETWGDLQSLKLQWKTICWRWCAKLMKKLSSRKCCDYSGQQRKIIEIEMISKYLDIARELKKLEVGRRVETIQITALLRTARILRRVLETCCHSNFSEKPSAKTDVKNSQGDDNNNKAMQCNMMVNINCKWCAWNDPQRLIKELEELESRGRVETLRITALLGSARILRRVLETWEDLLSLMKYHWCEKHTRSKIIIVKPQNA